MHKDDIIRMAREAGFQRTKMHNALEQFAYIVAAAEREACAQIAFNARTYLEAAAAIRKRGQE
jgi:hypothetical protein